MDIYFDRIKPLFDQSGKTDADLEREIGIPSKKISQWNIKYTKSYRKYVAQIASYFHVSTDYLLGNTDEPRPVQEVTQADAQQNSPVDENDGTVKSRLLKEVEDFTEEEYALLLAQIQKIKDIRV